MFTPLNIENTNNCLPFPWHPSVVYIPKGWNGHTYWMAQTPYPPMEIVPYKDRYELPCIHFSDDGINFYPIETNPIIDLNAEAINAHNYYSDPHLLFVNGKLELYFRYTILKDKQLIGNKTLLLKCFSSDGYHWSKPIVLADLRYEKDIKIWGEQIISHALCWNEQKYECWYVDKSSYLQGRKIRYVSSLDGKTWMPNKICLLDGPMIDPWHIDVQYYDGKYQMIVYDMQMLLWYDSDDGMHFRYISKILSPSNNKYDFYMDGLYRACSIKTEKKILVYFSARRQNRTYIGVLSTSDRVHFSKINGLTILKWLSIVWSPLLKAYLNRIIKLIKKIIKIK